MRKKIVNLALGLILILGGATSVQAQEDEATAKKKPTPQALADAKAKYREKKRAEKAKADAEAKAKAVDINHATKAELMKVPGITEAYANAIIAKRPYKSKADLVTKKVIPNGTFQAIRKQVAAK